MRGDHGSSARVLPALAVAAVLAACSEGGETGPRFAPGDLAGEWRYTIVFAGPAVSAGTLPGWARGTSTIDASGSATIQTYEDSTGSTTLPTLPPITYAISGDGIVTATTTAFAGTHGRMHSDKAFFVTTATQGAGATARVRLSLYQKVAPGVAYGPPDVASSTFSLHQLGIGSAPGWLHCRVVSGATRTYSLVGIETSAGPAPDVTDQGTLSVSADGVVTSTASASFRGFLSSDKQLIVGTQTDGPADHRLSILQRAGGAFATADLAGAWVFSNLAVTADDGAWIHGTVSFDAAGVGTFGPQTDSTGGSGTPTPVTLSVAAGGEVTTAPADTFHGTLTTDLLVATDTHEPGLFGVIVALR